MARRLHGVLRRSSGTGLCSAASWPSGQGPQPGYVPNGMSPHPGVCRAPHVAPRDGRHVLAPFRIRSPRHETPRGGAPRPVTSRPDPTAPQGTHIHTAPHPLGAERPTGTRPPGLDTNIPTRHAATRNVTQTHITTGTHPPGAERPMSDTSPGDTARTPRNGPSRPATNRPQTRASRQHPDTPRHDTHPLPRTAPRPLARSAPSGHVLLPASRHHARDDTARTGRAAPRQHHGHHDPSRHTTPPARSAAPRTSRPVPDAPNTTPDMTPHDVTITTPSRPARHDTNRTTRHETRQHAPARHTPYRTPTPRRHHDTRDSTCTHRTTKGAPAPARVTPGEITARWGRSQVFTGTTGQPHSPAPVGHQPLVLCARPVTSRSSSRHPTPRLLVQCGRRLPRWARSQSGSCGYRRTRVRSTSSRGGPRAVGPGVA